MPQGQRKTSKKNDNDAPVKKRGNQGDFHGKREEYLREHLQKYMDASDTGTTRDFWPDFFFNWWKKFPWWLKINEELPEDADATESTAKELTEEERAEKRRVLDGMEKVSRNVSLSVQQSLMRGQKIKAWFNYQRGLAGGGAKNPWAPLLKELRRLGSTTAPKKLPDYQCYMQRPENKEKIQQLFMERYPDNTGGRGKINDRAGIARELLAAESEQVREQISKLAEAEHDLAMKDWKAARDGIGKLDEEEQQE